MKKILCIFYSKNVFNKQFDHDHDHSSCCHIIFRTKQTFNSNKIHIAVYKIAFLKVIPLYEK